MNDSTNTTPANKYLRVIPPLILLAMTIIMLAFIIIPDKDFSENENRYLSAFPDVNLEDMKSGEWMSDFEDYICDQFPLRDVFVGLKTTFEKATLHTQINNIYLSDDGYYIEPYEQPQKTDMIIRRFNSLADSVDARIALMLVPTAVTVYEDKLPIAAATCSQMDTLNKIYAGVHCDTIDLSSLLLDNSSQDGLYYHLDHHWTLKGAYYGYKAYCTWAGLECRPMSFYNYKTVTDSFKGTIYSKINDYSVKGDTMLSFAPESSTITVTYPDGTVTDSIYDDSYLDVKDKYSYYLGNDSNSIITIENPEAATDESLVIIKDSYANSFIPYLVDYYRTIYVINPRYFRTTKISDYINDISPDKVLLLFNMNTIDTDDGIRAIF